MCRAVTNECVSPGLLNIWKFIWVRSFKNSRAFRYFFVIFLNLDWRSSMMSDVGLPECDCRETVILISLSKLREMKLRHEGNLLKILLIHSMYKNLLQKRVFVCPIHALHIQIDDILSEMTSAEGDLLDDDF